MSTEEFDLTPKAVPTVRTRHRRIVTPIPPAGSGDIIRRMQQVEPRSMGGTLPVVWDHAVDYQVFDPFGNCWIDLSSTIFVANAGHSNPAVIRAIEEQIRRNLLHNYCFPSEIRLRAAETLLAHCPEPLRKVFFLSTGSETSECILKLARLHGQRQGPARNGIICFEGSMHGRTLGAQMMGGNAAAKAWIAHPDPEIYHLSFPWRFRCPWRESDSHACDASCFHKSLTQLEKNGVNLQSIAAIVIEPYQGWGALFFPASYVQAARRWADEHNALLCFDEVQSGCGRTGRFFAFEHYGVRADLVGLGKGLASSMPVSAVLGRSDVMDLPPIGSMSSTHSGHPLACAAVIANLEEFKRQELLQKAQNIGAILQTCLHDLQKKFSDHILSVEGQGMVYALIITKPGTSNEDAALADRVAEKAMQKGVLVVHTGRGSIKIGPPLTIPEEAIREAVTVLDESFSESLRERGARA